MDPDDWGYFLCKVFDEWRRRDLGKVLVNHFETLVAQHMGLPSQICVYGEICGKGLAVEHDGGVYSCDHYVYPEYRVGNIHDGPLSDAVFSRAQVKFGYAKSETLPRQCRECPYLRDCWGECPKNRILRTADGEPGLNYLCSGFQRFFAHAIPHVERIVADLRQARHAGARANVSRGAGGEAAGAVGGRVSCTETVTFGIRPVKRDFASEPIASTTGVARSMPTSAVSSAEKIIGWVRSMRPSATFWSLTKSVPSAALAERRRRRRRTRSGSSPCRAGSFSVAATVKRCRPRKL